MHEAKHEAYGLHLWYRFDVVSEADDQELDRQRRVIAAVEAIQADAVAATQVHNC